MLTNVGLSIETNSVDPIGITSDISKHVGFWIQAVCNFYGIPKISVIQSLYFVTYVILYTRAISALKFEAFEV